MFQIPLFTNMLLTWTLANAVVAGTTTPPGFTPSCDSLLGVLYGNTSITPGMTIETSTVSTAPSLMLPIHNRNDTYVVLLADLDGTLNNQSGLLHWLYQDGAVRDDGTIFNSTSLAVYVGPSPPAGETHRYLFLAFSQPEKFATSINYDADIPISRAGFNPQAFANQTGLGLPYAVNYFLVSGTSSNTTTTASSPVATVTSTFVSVALSATQMNSAMLVSAVFGISAIFVAL
ncbi:hypothetical protein PFICI_11989 [Pestalotiopsis fici W106-1]|uniref:PEBP-like protein n=1 Tax=Pestalotiopsis fici (strain W106-1 / CGMCC3.15140) TaxID=1229662 RepID=W3WTV3_PESFW|nr:uncharacterized protein PFICI_11989 [Pestalotiopsis fici W106-1]ETS76602.1 hypothetical protein PFICI_11989 [Pestalotiopsis fici W106-1]